MSLIITRSSGQSFTIGDDVSVCIYGFYEFNGKIHAKLAIDAPKNIKILRDDIKKDDNKILIND